MRRALLLAAVVAILCAGNLIADDQEHAPRVSVHAGRDVYLDVAVGHLERPVYVPYCGSVEGGTLLLCFGAVHLQVEDKEGWRPVRLKWSGGAGMLGGMPRNTWNLKRVDPPQMNSFIYWFGDDLFHFEPGQRIRIVLDVWLEEHGLQDGARPVRLEGEPFLLPECP